jgi:hypothetical protein
MMEDRIWSPLQKEDRSLAGLRIGLCLGAGNSLLKLVESMTYV